MYAEEMMGVGLALYATISTVIGPSFQPRLVSWSNGVNEHQRSNRPHWRTRRTAVAL